MSGITPASNTTAQARTSKELSTPLTKEQILFFKENGYLVVQDLIPEEMLEELQTRLNEISRGIGILDSQKTKLLGQEGNLVFQKFRGVAQTDNHFRRLAQLSPLVDIIETLLQEEALIFRDVLVVKPAKEGLKFSWHQDSAYWDVEPPALISAWIPLSNVTKESGCLCVLKGSHQFPIEHSLNYGKYPLPSVFSRFLRKMLSLAGTGDKLEGEGGNRGLDRIKQFVLVKGAHFFPGLGTLGDFHLTKSNLAPFASSERQLPVSAGSVIFFHSLLIHGSLPNTSEHDRPAAIISYMGKSFRYTGRHPVSFLTARTPPLQ